MNQSLASSSSSSSSSPSFSRGFSTRAIHDGQTAEEVTGSIIPPIFLTSTFVQESPGKHKGYDYTRAGNPSFSNLERQIASLEEGEFCTVFSAGLSAMTGVILAIQKISENDGILALKSCYGGTYRLLKGVLELYGMKIFMANVDDEWKEIEEVMKNEKPAVFILETPTNPLMEIIDIERIVTMAKTYNVRVVIDNTFASPFHQTPLKYEVDAVLHSSTKYFGGHSDIIGGAVATNNKEIKIELDFFRMAMGLNPSPFDCWMLSRSLKTLGIRMERHSSNARIFAAKLSIHPKVKKVYYPGLPNHPQFEIAKKQMIRGFSGMLAVEFLLDVQQTMKFLSSMKVFSLAESLGGVESLVCHPASMTHASIPPEERMKIGIHDGLVRFSVGIENVEDLINDVEAAILIATETPKRNEN